MSDAETPSRHAPLLGEHNEYVLRELLGLSEPEVSELRQNDIIL